jgi:hypothetical protein
MKNIEATETEEAKSENHERKTHDMKANLHKAQRTVAAKTHKRGGCSLTAHREFRKGSMTWSKLHKMINHTEDHCYMSVAVDYLGKELRRRRVKPASLYDAETGKFTVEGGTKMSEVVEKVWAEQLRKSTEEHWRKRRECLQDCLSQRAVLDLVMAHLAENQVRNDRYKPAYGKALCLK